ncbi:hypothetical protein CLF_107341 [Clonorchis sinensis]|uniref:Uncharacterized protein n=1 Tax=Clonorchis sinensis TaxID=79923 RepID=H2KRW8_CLOSI|nr:hypothetical protein CLF_107341 [Clonorchis sinensis]
MTAVCNATIDTKTVVDCKPRAYFWLAADFNQKLTTRFMLICCLELANFRIISVSDILRQKMLAGSYHIRHNVERLRPIEILDVGPLFVGAESILRASFPNKIYRNYDPDMWEANTDSQFTLTSKVCHWTIVFDLENPLHEQYSNVEVPQSVPPICCISDVLALVSGCIVVLHPLLEETWPRKYEADLKAVSLSRAAKLGVPWDRVVSGSLWIRNLQLDYCIQYRIDPVRGKEQKEEYRMIDNDLASRSCYQYYSQMCVQKQNRLEFMAYRKFSACGESHRTTGYLFFIISDASGTVRIWYYQGATADSRLLATHQEEKITRTEGPEYGPKGKRQYNQLLACSCSFDSQRFVTAGDDYHIRVYDLNENACVRVLSSSFTAERMDGHVMRICAVKYHPRGAYQEDYSHIFISGSWDDTVQVWDDRFVHSLWVYGGPHISGSDALDIEPTSNTILTSSWRHDTTILQASNYSNYDVHVIKVAENLTHSAPLMTKDLHIALFDMAYCSFLDGIHVTLRVLSSKLETICRLPDIIGVHAISFYPDCLIEVWKFSEKIIPRMRYSVEVGNTRFTTEYDVTEMNEAMNERPIEEVPQSSFEVRSKGYVARWIGAHYIAFGGSEANTLRIMTRNKPKLCQMGRNALNNSIYFVTDYIEGNTRQGYHFR